jgi:hypothetical protein
MATGTIQRTITLFKSAVEGFNATISLIQLERLAIMVHRAMTAQARSFHTPEHIFELADGSNPLLALAALFHDIVYYQVDDGFAPEIHDILAPYILEEEDRLSIRPDIADPLLMLTMAVFGFEPGQTLSPMHGLNEFLSAVVMNKKLEGIVDVTDLIKTTACIEATIPFRRNATIQDSPPYILEQRLDAINAQQHWGMPLEEIREAVKWAVVFANRDVSNFSEEDTGKFLDNTWKLIPETNPSMRLRGVYSLRSYREALQKMEGFLRFLDPDDIYESYRGAPPPGEYQRMVALAFRNVYTGREYLGIKLLSAAIGEALANITGGDAPVALLLGEVEGNETSGSLEDLLPDIEVSPQAKVGSTLFGLLAFGRSSASSFDMQNSPLSLFIYKYLGSDNVKLYLNVAREMFDGNLTSRAFLDQLPAGLIVPIARACAVLALTRSAALNEYAASREPELETG